MENKGTYRIAVRGLIMHEGKFLLMKRSKLARGEHGFWELPGGGLDFGEAPEEALKREIEEEAQNGSRSSKAFKCVALYP